MNTSSPHPSAGMSCGLGVAAATLLFVLSIPISGWIAGLLIGLAVGTLVGYLTYDPQKVARAAKETWPVITDAVRYCLNEMPKPRPILVYDLLWGINVSFLVWASNGYVDSYGKEGGLIMMLIMAIPFAAMAHMLTGIGISISGYTYKEMVDIWVLRMEIAPVPDLDQTEREKESRHSRCVRLLTDKYFAAVTPLPWRSLPIFAGISALTVIASVYWIVIGIHLFFKGLVLLYPSILNDFVLPFGRGVGSFIRAIHSTERVIVTTYVLADAAVVYGSLSILNATGMFSFSPIQNIIAVAASFLFGYLTAQLIGIRLIGQRWLKTIPMGAG